MFAVKCITAVVCLFYGIYVYRVFRHAEYHDLKWLFQCRKKASSVQVASSNPEYQQNGHLGQIDIISDDSAHRVRQPVRRTYPKMRMNAQVESHKSNLHRHSGYPPNGSQN